MIASSSCASALLSFALQPARKHTDPQSRETLEWIESRSPGCADWYTANKAAGRLRDTFIISDDGVRLHALYGEASEESRRTAVIVHGYQSAPEGLTMIARMYRDSLGYNVLLPSLRRHGRSGGREVQMGWNDRLDVKNWCRVAHDIFSDTLQVCHGISMGGATVMMLSGEEDLPGYVRGIVEDCGYTSVWEEFDYLLRDSLKIKAPGLLQHTDELCLKRYGWSFTQASSIDMVARSTVPMLFIHGSADTYVPPRMGEACYEAKTEGSKELWITDGVTHASSYTRYPDEYTQKVRRFLKEKVE